MSLIEQELNVEAGNLKSFALGIAHYVQRHVVAVKCALELVARLELGDIVKKGKGTAVEDAVVGNLKPQREFRLFVPARVGIGQTVQPVVRQPRPTGTARSLVGEPVDD